MIDKFDSFQKKIDVFSPYIIYNIFLIIPFNEYIVKVNHVYMYVSVCNDKWSRTKIEINENEERKSKEKERGKEFDSIVDS